MTACDRVSTNRKGVVVTRVFAESREGAPGTDEDVGLTMQDSQPTGALSSTADGAEWHPS